MRSIKEIFVIGHGPSSSHTMGPGFACEEILKKYGSDIKKIKVTLYGSLASTGKGHLTDYIIDLKLKEVPHEIVMNTTRRGLPHPNLMKFETTLSNGLKKKDYVASIGGGTIVTKENINKKGNDTYPHQHLKEIQNFCTENHMTLEEYVIKYEDKDIIKYLGDVYDAMEAARSRGISASGELPGELHVARKARAMYLNMRASKDGKTNIRMNVAISSFAVAEENAAGGIVSIAPTCGSAGVIPGAITYLKMMNYSREDIVHGLLVAGLIGIIAKTNASVSGAECGCQAEIGVACAMASAMIADVLDKNNIFDIGQAAEIAMEHSLGLTCDPVKGYVQIPCIERCAIFALKAIDAATLSKIIPTRHSMVNFDQSLETMYQTGLDLEAGYKETASDGLAKLFK